MITRIVVVGVKDQHDEEREVRCCVSGPNEDVCEKYALEDVTDEVPPTMRLRVIRVEPHNPVSVTYLPA